MGNRRRVWAAVLAGGIGCNAPIEGTRSDPVTTVTAAAESGTTDPSTSSAGSEESEGSSGIAAFDPSFIEAQVEGALAAGVPGLAIAVVADGEVVYAQGHGSAGASGVVDAHTLFSLASVSKAVTAMALLGQRDAGLLALDDSVVTHVPYFGLDAAFDPTSVRVEHLLLHTSGIGDWETEPFAWVETLASSFALNANQPLWAPAGSIHDYSNRGYTLAGLVAAEVQGTSFADAVAMQVLEPLAMNDATMDAAEVVSRPHAEGRSGSEWVGPADFLGELYQPSGGLWASAEDLGALVLGLLAHEEMGAPHFPTHESYGQHYGYGLYVETGLDPIVVHHGGSTAGYLADVQLVPQRGFGVAVVINTDAFDVGSISYAILEHYAGPFANVDVEGPFVDATQVPGTYVDPWQLGTLEVAQAGAGSTLTFVDLGATVEMEEPWPGAWFIEDPETGYELGLTFWPDATGNPTHLVTRRGIAARQ